MIGLLASLLTFAFAVSAGFASPELAVRGRFFVAADGRTVLLRGVNVSTAVKLPPFDPFPDGHDRELLLPLVRLGLNTIRLPFSWEGYEPERGRYNEAYLERYAELAGTAWSLGLNVIIDMHQDSFSRYVGDGCGAGFPAWITASREGEGEPPSVEPPYKDCGTLWAIKTAASPAMHRAYSAFYRNANGARDGLVEVWRRVARRMKSVPGVVAYDLINEFWGDENRELGPLEADLAASIRREDPGAVVLVEPGLLSVLGLAGNVNMDRPRLDNFAYAPHFYDAFAAGALVYLPDNPFTEAVFNRMPRQAREWGVPLFVGEFGGYAGTKNLEALMARQYDLLDEALASGTQWNYTPTWTPGAKDGWNSEDYSIVDNTGKLRGNFVEHPYPRRTAGRPLKFAVERDGAHHAVRVVARWENDPAAGQGRTEIYLPRESVFGERPVVIQTHGPGLTCAFSEDRHFLLCESREAGQVEVRVSLAVPRPGD